MIRSVLLSLAVLAAGATPVIAQTGTNTAAANTLSPRPSPPTAPAKPKNAAYVHLENFTRGFMQVQTQYTGNLIADTLAAALQRSRDNVRPQSMPIPEEVKRELVPFYPAELLDGVHYTIGDTSEAGLAGFAIRNGNAAAVTLIDTIVFKEDAYLSSLALWAHELHHIEQYKTWGLGGFAMKYAFNWKDVEAEASARANAYVAWYRERKASN